MSGTNHRTPSRRIAVALAAVPLVALLIADAGLAIRRSADGSSDHASEPRPHTTATTQADRAAAAEAERAAAIRDLIRHRAHAVMHRDRAEWRSTLDPGRPEFRRRQVQLFDNLVDVPLRSWSYSFDPTAERPPVARSTRYGVPSWSPATFRLHYRLSGFDRRATSLMQYPTFVHRAGGWYFASFDDFRAQGRRSSTDLWDFGPVSVVRTDQVLVLGHPDSLATMQSLATEVTADLPRVTSVWGSDWARRVVVLVPSTQHELSRVVNDYGDLNNIAAVATAEVTVGAGDPNPVGDRIGINPANWPKLSLLGRRIVITHELTHVASRAFTSTATPKWLAEGFADYIGYLGSGVPTDFVAQDLRSEVLAGRAPRSFPTDESFRGSSAKLSQSYESSWLLCQLIARRWGEAALVRFYRTVGRSHERAGAAVDAAAMRVLHLSSRELRSQWHSYVRSELA